MASLLCFANGAGLAKLVGRVVLSSGPGGQEVSAKAGCASKGELAPAKVAEAPDRHVSAGGEK